MSYDAWKLATPAYLEGGEGPCGRCEHDFDEHEHCDDRCPPNHFAGDKAGDWCGECNEACEFIEAERCACGALVSRNCRCD